MISHFVYKYLPLSERFIYNQIRYIKKFKTSVITTDVINDKFPFDEIHSLSSMKFPFNSLETLRFKITGNSNFFENALSDTSLIHAHFGNSSLKILKIAKKRNIPLVTSFYGNDATKYPKTNPGVYKELFSYSKAFLVPSFSLKGDIEKLDCPSDRIKVLRLGVDVNFFRFKKREHKEKARFLSVARFVEKKGLTYLITAFSNLLEDGYDAELVLCGNGPLKGRLASHARNLGIKGKVTFIDNFSSENPRKVVLEEMYKSDVMITPSVTSSDGDKESLNLVNLEAASTGMPVISTFHNGIPEVVENGKTGILVSEKSHSELYEKMKLFMENPKYFMKLGKNGAQKVRKEFTIGKQNKELEKVYNVFAN
ncbi:MAG: glycosyltransferase [Candidatus Aenigmarchaeota archaeon]|nr:glycosyltransferase [Candidatus Aenigmarchaeota archaeon]